MLIFDFLIRSTFDFYLIAFLLRFAMYYTCCNLHNPIVEFIINLTQPIIKQLVRFFPIFNLLDLYSLLFALVLSILKFPILTFIETKSLFLDSTYLLIGFLVFLKSIGELIFWIIFLRSLFSLSIFEYNNPIKLILYQLSQPIINKIQFFVPNVKGVDISSIVIILLLFVLNNIGIYIFPNIWYKL